MNKKIGIALSLVLLGSSLTAAKDPSPIPFNGFDGASPGARPLAMGLAYTAVAEGPEAAYYNPAGLHTIPTSLMSVSFEAARQGDISFDQLFGEDALRNQNLIFAAFAGQKGSFSWRPLANLTIHRQSPEGWENDEININAFTFSVSQEAGPKLSTSLNLSYLTGRVGSGGILNGIPSVNLSDGNGFSMDIGFLYAPAPVIRMGINFQNLLGFMWWDDYEKDILPLTVRSGLAYRISGVTTFSSDLVRRFYRKGNAPDTQTLHFGIEQSIAGLLKLRAGMYGEDLNNKETAHFTGGIGYEMNNYFLSLALDTYKVNLVDIHRYVVSLDLPL